MPPGPASSVSTSTAPAVRTITWLPGRRLAIGVVAVTAADAPGTVEGVDVVGTVGTVVRGDKVVSGVVAPAGSRVTMVSPRPAEGSAVVVVVGLMMKAAVNGCVLGVVGSGGVVIGASVDAGAVVVVVGAVVVVVVVGAAVVVDVVVVIAELVTNEAINPT